MSDPEPIPRATVRRRRFSLTWLVPLLALGVLGFVVFQQVNRTRGMLITISFEDAQGIEPDSEIVHRGIRVGIVRDVALSDDLKRAVVTAELDPSATALAVEGTQFWVVRPELSLQQVSGLDTLIGPNYIALRPGEPGGATYRVFEGLGASPAIDPSEKSLLVLTLFTDRLGTLQPGVPVLYREIPVGAVRSARLDDDATRVLVEIQIEPRYAPLVKDDSRFWRSGGVGVDFGLFTGLSVRADSLESVLGSSISFATPENPGAALRADRVFELADEPKDSWLEWSPSIKLGVP
jgi:paraquat-inducible protein B